MKMGRGQMDDWGTSREAFVALVIGDAAGDATRAIDLAGGRTRQRLGWTDVAAGLGPQAGNPVLVVDTTGVADALLAEALPLLANATKLLDLPAVVALAPAQIDRVTAAMMGDRVQFLCDPTIAERVVALTVAVELTGDHVLYDRVSEGEAARLARLNAEVARIAEVLARLSRREDAAIQRGDIADRRQPFGSGQEPAPGEEPADAATIRATIRARRLRDKQFDRGLFEDPAWDMLLDLYAAHLERAQVSVSSLCIAAAVAPTTALRWIAKMSDAGLLVREADPFDRRRAFMALSPQALSGMRAYAAAARAQGLPIV